MLFSFSSRNSLFVPHLIFVHVSEQSRTSLLIYSYQTSNSSPLSRAHIRAKQWTAFTLKPYANKNATKKSTSDTAWPQRTWYSYFLVETPSDTHMKRIEQRIPTYPQSRKGNCVYPPSGGGFSDGGRLSQDILVYSPTTPPANYKENKFIRV